MTDSRVTFGADPYAVTRLHRVFSPDHSGGGDGGLGVQLTLDRGARAG